MRRKTSPVKLGYYRLCGVLRQTSYKGHKFTAKCTRYDGHEKNENRTRHFDGYRRWGWYADEADSDRVHVTDGGAEVRPMSVGVGSPEEPAAGDAGRGGDDASGELRMIAVTQACFVMAAHASHYWSVYGMGTLTVEEAAERPQDTVKFCPGFEKDREYLPAKDRHPDDPRPICLQCATWVCQGCWDYRRQRASRHPNSAGMQYCPKCGGREGEFIATRHLKYNTHTEEE